MCDSIGYITAAVPVFLLLVSEYLGFSKKFKPNSLFDLFCCVFCVKRVVNIETEDIDTESGGNIQILHVEMERTRGTKV